MSRSRPYLPFGQDREKLPRYQEAGIEEIWIVDPFTSELRVERKTSKAYTAQALSSGRLESTVLGGFWIDVGWLWQTELPSSMECLRLILSK